MSEKLKAAKNLLLEAAEEQECKWCRSHILRVAQAVDHLVYLSGVGEEMKTHPGSLKAMRFIGRTVEEVGVVSLLTKLSTSRLIRFFVR